MRSQNLTDISIPERRVCERLGTLLQEHAVGDSLGDLFSARDLTASFEFFLPEVLREVYGEWRHESLDGVCPRIFRKIGDREAELLGLAIFISDQTLTPIHFQLQLSPRYTELPGLNCDWVSMSKTDVAAANHMRSRKFTERCSTLLSGLIQSTGFTTLRMANEKRRTSLAGALGS